jgi:hypothetical protein
MQNIWHFLINPFLVLARKNLKRFYKLTFLFMEALYAQNSNVTIGNIYTATLPSYTAFRALYVTKKSKIGIRIGDTRAQKKKFEDLYQTMMPAWNIKIMPLMAPTSDDYLKIFPQGFTPLSQGSMEEKLAYFKSIIETMEGFPVLDAIRAEMETFRTEIDTLRGTRAHSGTNAETSATELHLLAEELAIDMFGALGLLINLFKKNPEKILDFVIVQLLRFHQKPEEEEDDIYELQLAGGETKAAEFVFTINEKLRIYNSGNFPLRFWFVKTVGDPMPTSYFDVEADAVKEFFINVYANADDRYLMVKNLHDTEEGSVEIEKVD